MRRIETFAKSWSAGHLDGANGPKRSLARISIAAARLPHTGPSWRSAAQTRAPRSAVRRKRPAKTIDRRAGCRSLFNLVGRSGLGDAVD